MPPALDDESKQNDLSSSYRSSDEHSFHKAGVSVVSANRSVFSTAATVTSEDGGSSVLSSHKAAELRKPRTTGRRSFSYQAQSNDSTNQALDFESMPLIGREREVATLDACFARMIDASLHEKNNTFESRKELVLIAGKSGSGKTAVTRTLEKEVLKHTNGIFVQGKFDMNTSSEPFSGICKAFGSLCLKIKEAPAQALCTVQACINKELGSDVDLLLHLIPELRDLISDTFNDPAVMDIGADEIDSKVERLRFAFRVLMRAFSSAASPMVLFLDDLQWSDVSSLQVLDFLMTDAQNENPLMIIGCYRSDEVDENSLLHNKIVALQEMTEKHWFHLTEIEVGHFGINEIEQIITSTLPNPNVAGTLGLATICLKRTLGNPFFVLEFLKMLHQEGLLHCDANSDLWTWDVDKIDGATMSTANVVAMLHDQMTKLPHQVQALLQCAAYIGSTFTGSTIDLVWTSYGRRLVESKTERTALLLDFIVKEQILEKADNNTFRWVHDKLQEAALSLTGKRRESFQLDIGRTLYYGLDKNQVEDELFAIVDLINSGNVLRLTEFASANLRAAEKARDLSAFQSAAEYAAHGIGLLKNDKWSTDRSLTLKLYTLAAEMEAMVGNFAASERYSSEVLSQPDLSIMETIPLKMAKASSTGSNDLKFDDSVKVYLQLLDEMGCKVTWARRLVPVQSIVKLMRIIKRVKATPQSFYDKMVPMDDPRQKAIATVYSKLVYYSYMAGDMLLFVLTACKLVEMTLDYGVNEFSAKCFASLGSAIIISMEDYTTATTFNTIALSMLRKFRGMHSSETTFIIFGANLCWVKPFNEVLTPMGNVVTEGLRSGDLEYAICNLVSNKISLPYTMGRPLASILNECPKTLIQCEDAAQSSNAMALKVLWQMMKNLSDPSCPNPSELEGDIFSAESDEETLNTHVAFVNLAQGELALFNGDYETAAKRALEVKDMFAKLCPGFLVNIAEPFSRAVPLYAAARSTKKRKYRVEARRLLKMIGKWKAAGNPNVLYYHLFLTAEQFALDKKYDSAQQKYEEAIEAVTAVGHLHHLGLIHERYSDFLEERSMNEKSKESLRQAIRYYREWGAGVKVERLEQRL
ncbi:unnamed protein product [Cylindrotheca closterium]|uniref:Orc1-like AAA ATPase domain-containing protein n=1 Tax=Cylindrotheca closterium TaxID=2856 RepID=A0AAD2GBH5_9STRA|nr:unnamed protein product [Cylindrotheca closterium]